MSQAFSGLIFFIAITFPFVIGWIVVERRALWKDKARCKLFQCRDKLLNLVVTGKVDKSDLHFKMYYDLVNSAIAASPSAGITIFIETYFRHRQQRHLQEKTNEWKKFSRFVRTSDKHLSEWYDEFSIACAEMLGLFSFSGMMFAIFAVVAYAVFKLAQLVFYALTLSLQRKFLEVVYAGAAALKDVIEGLWKIPATASSVMAPTHLNLYRHAEHVRYTDLQQRFVV